MPKICFAVLNDAGLEKVVCAHENEQGEGLYLGTCASTFQELSLDKQIEKINEMIIAVTNAADVKRGIKFSEYQRQ